MELKFQNLLKKKKKPESNLEGIVGNFELTEESSPEQVLSLVRLTYNKMFPGKKLKTRIRMLPDMEMRKRFDPDNKRNLVPGVTDIGLFGKTIYLNQDIRPSAIMRFAGHELGHVYAPLSYNLSFNETGAELFKFFWEDQIILHNIGGLSLFVNSRRSENECLGISPYTNPLYSGANLFAWEIYQRNKGCISKAFEDFMMLQYNPGLISDYTGGRIIFGR